MPEYSYFCSSAQKQEKALEADKVEFTKDWNKNGRDVDKAAEVYRKSSQYMTA